MNQAPPAGIKPTVSTGAVWSLVLGILSILCFGIFTGIPAIVLGHRARAQIRGNPTGFSGDGLALAGLITGYAGTALMILGFIFGVVRALFTQGSSVSPFIKALF